MKKMNWINLFRTVLCVILTSFCLVFIMAEPTESSMLYWTLILMKFAGIVCGFAALMLAEKLSSALNKKEKEEL